MRRRALRRLRARVGLLWRLLVLVAICEGHRTRTVRTLGEPSTNVVLLECRALSVLHVDTRRISNVSLTAVKRVILVATRHHPATAHQVVHMVANLTWVCLGRASRAHTEANLAVTHIVHPLLIKHLLACL